MNKPKLAIIGTVGLPAKYGGFETLVEQLVLNISDEYDITVYCSGKFYPKSERIPEWEGAKLKYIPLNANGFQSIPYDIWSIVHAAFKADLLLILGVSGCFCLPFVKFFTKKNVYVNIDGIEWKRDKWSGLIKRILRYSEITAVEVAEEIITDNEVIRKYLKSTYDYDSHLIEYGGDQAFEVQITAEDIKKYAFLSKKYAFSVCRIEPENHIHVILKAMAKQTDLPLVLVGNWKKSDYGLQLLKEYGDLAQFHLLDPIYEKEPLNLLRANCFLYLHGHSAGGTNPSLVEAMNLGLCIIAFDIGYNRETTEDEALFFKDASSLLQQIKQLTEAQHQQVSHAMLRIAKKRYTWQVIAKKYAKMMRVST